MRDLILRLARPMLRMLGRDDRGAVGVLIAVLIGGGVLLGMGALVIDVGMLYSERAQLQNGADAAALAVAKSCALGTCNPAVAPTYADANANDQVSAVDLVCGLGGTLAACQQPSTGAMVDCPPASAGVNYVDVHTSTKTPNGSTVVPPFFGRALLGNGAYSGTNVKACAQAEWGPPSAATASGFTISACEWDTATSNGTSFAPLPPYPPNPAASYDQSLTLHTGNTSGTCPANPADADAPGAFGWVQDKNTTCAVPISNNQYFAGTGVEAGVCASILQAAWTKQTVVYVAIYSSVASQGSNTVYTLKGFAAFVVTGYRLPGNTEPDWLNKKLLCHAPNVCIDGLFVKALCIPPACPDLGGRGLGLTAVRLSG